MSAACPACGGLTVDWPRPSCDSPINHDIWDLPKPRVTSPGGGRESGSSR